MTYALTYLHFYSLNIKITLDQTTNHHPRHTILREQRSICLLFVTDSFKISCRRGKGKMGGGDNVYVSLKISNKLKACCPRLPFSGQFLVLSLSQAKNQNQSIRNVCNEKRTLNFDFENKLLTNKINSIYQK